jgi:hypothetical protein
VEYALAAQQHRPPGRLDAAQAAEFAGLAPGQQQRPERLQQAAQLRLRSARAARNQADAAVVFGEDLQQLAGLAIGAQRQHMRRLEIDRAAHPAFLLVPMAITAIAVRQLG